MNRKSQASAYISLLSSLTDAAQKKSADDAVSSFLRMTERIQEDFCPPFDRASLLVLSADICALAHIRCQYTNDREDERFFVLFSAATEGLYELLSSEYPLGNIAPLIALCAKKSRTPLGIAYLACVRSLLSLIGNGL